MAPAPAVVAELNAQIAREFAAGQQYLAVAVWLDDRTFPRLSAFFYAQADEERGHALMMTRYLLDQDVLPEVPGVAEPKRDFTDLAEPVRVALEQERKVTAQITSLARLAHEEGDLVSEQFMQWFLKEQVEEEATMSSLLDVVERSLERPMDIEDFLVREGFGGEGEDPSAPPLAGA